jgi:predicted membrane protein
MKKSSQKEDFCEKLVYDKLMFKIVALATSILAVIAVCVYFLFFQIKPIWTIETSTTDAVPTVTSYEQERITVTEKNAKNSELYNTAMQEQDISLCVGISDEDKKIECHDMIVATTAKKSGTIETCDTLTNTGVVVLCRDVISTDQNNMQSYQ